MITPTFSGVSVDIRLRRDMIRWVLPFLSVLLSPIGCSNAEEISISSLFHSDSVTGTTNGTTYYQISTLSAPHKCLHITPSSVAVPSSSDNVGPDFSLGCLDSPHHWFDGTNGCLGYHRNPTWCEEFGSLRYPSVSTTAIEGCCACGGGEIQKKLRFSKGDEVLVYPSLAGLKPKLPSKGDTMVRAEVLSDGKDLPPGVAYEVRFLEDARIDVGQGRFMVKRKGTVEVIHGDSDDYISRLPRQRNLIELRRCISSYDGEDIKDQLFAMEKKEDSAVDFNIRHPGTRLHLTHFPPEKVEVEDDDFFFFVGGGTVIKFNSEDTLLWPEEFSETEQFGDFSLLPAFPESEEFKDSSKYFYIFVGPNKSMENDNEEKQDDSDDDNADDESEALDVCLVNGKFGAKDYSAPLWSNKCLENNSDRVVYTMWMLRSVEVEVGKDGLFIVAGDDDQLDGRDTHADWLEEVALSSSMGIERLRQVAPWSLLDVERNADGKLIKDRFRELSRTFHPDKRRMQSTGTGADAASEARVEELFMLLQQAYDGLKSKDERKKEKFKVEAEVEEQLFARSTSVVELLPSMWKYYRDGELLDIDQVADESDTDEAKNGRYVISFGSTIEKTNMTDTNDSTETTFVANSTIDSAHQDSNIQGWLLFLYSPRCGMSRASAAFVELAAAHLKEKGIMVGAYGCGVHGESRDVSKKKGFVGWMEDPVCKQFGRKETPNTHYVMEVIGNNVDPITKKRAADFTNFYATAATGTPKDLWPRRLINFASLSQKAWEDSAHIEAFTKEDFKNPEFSQTLRAIAFIDPAAKKESREIQDALMVALPSVAKRIVRAEGRVGVVSCATEIEMENDKFAVDCSKLGVSWLPDVKLFGVNQTKGESVLTEEYSERRDIQITLEVMANTIISVMGLEREDESIVDDTNDELEIEDDGDSQPQCGAKGQPMDEYPAYDGPELEAPEERNRLESGQQKKPRVKLDNRPATPKLDTHSKRANLSQRGAGGGGSVHLDASKASARVTGGGTIYGGGGGGGSFGGSIAG